MSNEYAQRPEQGTAWVDIFKIGAEVHKGGEVVTLSREMVVEMLDNFGALTKDGYEIVVLREHERNGHIFGFVHALRLMEGYLQANLEFLRPEDRIAYNNGQLRRFSPGFTLNYRHPHTGEEMGATLLEVSFVSMPYQTNLRPPQEASPETRLAFNYTGDILTGESTMANEAKTEAPVEEPVEASDVELGEEEYEGDKIDQVLGMLEKMMALMLPDEEEEDEEMADEALSDAERQIRELSAKVDRLHDEKTRVELRAAGVSEEHHDRLVKLARTDRELFEFTAHNLGEAAESRQAPIGVTGDADVSGTATTKDILFEAENAGVEYGAGLTAWLHRNYPEQRDSVLAVARNHD